MKAVSAATMRELDRRTIAAGTAGEVLMERAGMGAWQEISSFCGRLTPAQRRRLLVLTGKGNNGGDGHVIARLAAADGMDVTVASVCALTELTDHARLNAGRLPEAVEVIENATADRLRPLLAPGTVVVDALLGTGIHGDVRAPFLEIIRAVNDGGYPVVAVTSPRGSRPTADT